MGIAGPSAFVALNQIDPVRNSLDEVFSLQNTTGGLPYSGPLISLGSGLRYVRALLPLSTRTLPLP